MSTSGILGIARGLVLGLGLLATSGWSAPVTWTGAASPPSGSAAANWKGGHPPVDGDSVVFDGAARLATTVDPSARLDTLTFELCGLAVGPDHASCAPKSFLMHRRESSRLISLLGHLRTCD